MLPDRTPEWGLSWTIDGFGNRLAQNVTKGTAPVVSLTVNPANNRISSAGFGYDANGNQTQWTQGLDTVTAGYDVENRMTSVTSPSYVEVYKYNAANQRLVKDNQFGTQRKHYVYGLGGELLGEYEECSTGGSWYVPCSKKERIYFAGRFVQEEGVWKGTDRLGTVGQTAARAYPYGEANSEFATYRRDTLSGLDYAWNRYYSSTWGRFTTPDPYQASGGPENPQSWNRYSYVENDPVNYLDQSGLQKASPWIIWNIWTQEGWMTYFFANWSYDPEPGEGGGGGGEPPEETVRVSLTKELRKKSKAALNAMSEDCKNDFKKRGWSLDKLLTSADTIKYYDATTSEGAMTIQQVNGSQWTVSLASILGKNRAVTLPDSYNAPTPNVVIGESFNKQANTNLALTLEQTQWVTLVHELLHVYTKLNDSDLSSAMGLNRGVGASGSISMWLGLTCF